MANLAIVIVIYQAEQNKPLIFENLDKIFSSLDHINQPYLIIYDNSPLPLSTEHRVSYPHIYFHDQSNPGLAEAYNFALKAAEAQECKWLLLLDQDTLLTARFISELSGIIEKINDDRIAAIIPRLYANKLLISPSTITLNQLYRPLYGKESGVATQRLTAINSATTLRISFLKHIGGFNTRYWLDYLDHWVFMQISLHGHTIYLMESELTHNLSIQSLSTMGATRYRNILDAEHTFLHESENAQLPNLLIYKLRLLLRSLYLLLYLRRSDLFLAATKRIFNL
jgi:GT2 family glycosyltransferase